MGAREHRTLRTHGARPITGPREALHEPCTQALARVRDRACALHVRFGVRA